VNEQSDRFRSFISVMIALVTVLASITAFMQSYSSAQDTASDRRAQKLSLEATNRRLTGILQFSYDWEGAFQTWREVDLQVTSAELEGDPAAAERYRALRDELLALSPLLKPPYFDGEPWTFPDTYRYESDLYLVDATRLSEQFAAEAEVGNAWHNLANVFVIQLSLLAVTLSLFGLSTMMKGMIRLLFVVVGSSIILVNLVWTGILLILPKPSINMIAIDAYAQGVGQSYQAYDQTDSREAIKLFDQAIAAKPDYANAYYERGNAYYNLGEYEAAITDYEAAIENGRADANARWNLGWTYYLVGRYDEAAAINEMQIADDPTLIGLRFNQALVLLARGDFSTAESEYNDTILEAERQVTEAHAAGVEPSASLWFYLDAAALDLQNLLDQLNGTPKSWNEAPTPDLIPGNPDQIVSFAREQIKVIKEASVGLEYTGRLPDTSVNMTVTDFAYGIASYDDQGYVSDFKEMEVFPNSTAEASVYFEYSGDLPEHQFLWKVYQNGVENRSMRDLWDIDLGESSAWYKTIGFSYTNIFVLPPAEYTVELYVDYRLIKTGTFQIEE
jgi:tetratricopeptide (TPR) repeat protein